MDSITGKNKSGKKVPLVEYDPDEDLDEDGYTNDDTWTWEDTDGDGEPDALCSGSVCIN